MVWEKPARDCAGTQYGLDVEAELLVAGEAKQLVECRLVGELRIRVR